MGEAASEELNLIVQGTTRAQEKVEKKEIELAEALKDGDLERLEIFRTQRLLLKRAIRKIEQVKCQSQSAATHLLDYPLSASQSAIKKICDMHGLGDKEEDDEISDDQEEQDEGKPGHAESQAPEDETVTEEHTDELDVSPKADSTAATEEEAEVDIQSATSPTPEEEKVEADDENQNSEDREAKIEKLQQLVQE